MKLVNQEVNSPRECVDEVGVVCVVCMWCVSVCGVCVVRCVCVKLGEAGEPGGEFSPCGRQNQEAAHAGCN